MAGAVWVLAALFAAGGWFVSFRGGVVAQRSMLGSFWLRLLIFAALAFPCARFVFRRETKNQFGKIQRRIMCTKCYTAAEGEVGMSCECGGTFVSQSTVKWIED